jgi:hypothetical protein
MTYLENIMPTPNELVHQAELLDDEQWLTFLEALDEASRRRRQQRTGPAMPAADSRDEVAAWVARKHLLADSGIREVRYLLNGAPRMKSGSLK